MKNKNKMKIGAIAAGLVVIVSCGSAKEQTEETPQQVQREQPSVIEILTDMDEDKDGRISESEAKGPVKDDFYRIDTDRDGFLSVDELKNAPKPERKSTEGRPPQGGRPQGGPPRN